MTLLIFKTDIKSKKKIETIHSLFKKLSSITNWNIDTQDIDNVLRIETTGQLKEQELISLIQTQGFYCESLPD